jgi:hypothetical protein
MRYDRDITPGSVYRARLTSIARSILDDKCMYFLGSGASLGPDPSLPTSARLSRQMAGEYQLDSAILSRCALSRRESGSVGQVEAGEDCLPTVANLSREMAGQCQLDWYDYIPLSTIAFYYESYFTRDDLNGFLVKQLCRPDIPPSPTIRKLMSLVELVENQSKKTTFTITTNYDDKFEVAYQEKFHRGPEVIIYEGAHDPHDRGAKLNFTPSGPLKRDAQYWKPEKATVLYKMHGCISRPQGKGLVITEEDYINFLTNALNEDDHDKTLLNYFKGELGYRTILFIGYSLSDWNFRAIFKATVEKHKDRGSRL